MSEYINKEVVDFILSDNKHIELAASINQVFDSVRSVIIKDFSIVLCNKLSKEFKSSEGWVIDFSLINADPFGAYTGMSIRNNNWPEKLYVSVEAQKKGALNWVYGIYCNCDKKEFKKASDIQADINMNLSQGNTSNSWPWYRYSHKDWINWNTPKALSSMFDGENGEICSYYFDCIKTLVDRVTIFLSKSS